MGRCRFVQPGIVRLYLVDVHRRAHAELEKLVAEKKEKPEALIASLAKIEEAETDAEWIDVKRELTAGEQRHIFTGVVKTMDLGEKTTLDPDQVGKTKLLEYIVGWSFLGFDGQPEHVSEGAIDTLDIETYRELVAAVDAHELAMTEAREKKVAGATTS